MSFSVLCVPPARRVVTLGAVLLAMVTVAPAQPPPVERPTYSVGQTWIRDDGTYELVRIENDRYVFSAGSGREVRLTRDLTVARVERDGTFFEIDPPPSLRWPLQVGSGESHSAVRRSPGNRRGAHVVVTWRVEAVEEISIAGRTLRAYRIRTVQRFTTTGRQTTLVTWYAPEVRQLVKTDGDDWATFKFAVTSLGPDDPGGREPSPARAAPPGPLPPGTAAVARVAGDVDLRRKGASTWTPAPTGSRLAEGDELRTGRGASATVGLPAAARLVVAESSHIRMTKLDYNAASGERALALHVLAGKLFAELSTTGHGTRAQHSSFVITTPYGVAAVSGGLAVVAYDQAAQRALVAALRSSTHPSQQPLINYVDLATATIMTLTGGRYVVQDGANPPSAPAPVATLPAAVQQSLELPAPPAGR